MVEVLLATYNGAEYIQSQIDSILTQSYTDCMITIRDDQSTDETPAILSDYCRKYPDKIKVVKDNAHLGVFQSFAELIRQSSGDYLMLCDQDDVWLDTKIETFIKKMQELEQENPDRPVLVFGDLQVTDSTLNVVYPSLWKSQRLFPDLCKNYKTAVAHNVVTGCNTIFNRHCIPYILPVPKGIYHDYWIYINVAYNGIVDYITTPLMLYRQHTHNVVGKETISLLYMLKHTKNLFRNYRAFHQLNFGINFMEFLLIKLKINIRRLLMVD